MIRLRVHIQGKAVGTLEGPDPYVFGYDRDAAASLAVSLTMPVRLQSWTDQALHPIFQMNLPEGAMLIAIRQAIAKIARTDDLSLLQILGGYQIGRNRFTSADQTPPQTSAENRAFLSFRPKGEIFKNSKSLDSSSLSLLGMTQKGEIQSSLDGILKYPDTAELFRDFMGRFLLRSGISGVQPKVLINARDRATFRSSSYVVKSWGDDYPQLAANEYFCMTAAVRSGLPTPEFHLSDDGRLFVMKRFDIGEDGKDSGFEDMCVLQGVGADRKYDSTYERIARSIDQFVSPRRRGSAKETFFKSLVLSVAVRNGDAHLKNYGVLYGDQPGADIRLAPIYDIVTTAAYIPRDIPALTLGGSKKWWTGAALRKFGVAHCGLSLGMIREIFDAVTGAVGETRGEIRRYANDHPVFRDIAARMEAEWEKGLETLEK
jgi:serine/threonine-protein kinase HipA